MVGRGSRLDLAAKMGCDDVVDYEKEDPVAGVRRLTGGRGVDYVFDCTGNPVVPAQAIGSVRRGGRIGLCSGSPEASRPRSMSIASLSTRSTSWAFDPAPTHIRP